MNIAIFQSDLRVGGIQKALINLLRCPELADYAVDLFLFDENIFFNEELPANVTVRFLKPYPYWNRFVFFGLQKYLFRPLPIDREKHYDVAIDFNGFWNECALGALQVRADRRVMWIHGDIAAQRKAYWRARVLWFFSRGKYRRFDRLVAVSQGAADSFTHLTKGKASGVGVIPNQIDTREIFEKRKEPVDFAPDPNKLNLISCGRLYVHKGYDLLIGYMAKVKEIRKDCALYILGDGPDRQKLTEQIRTLGLEDTVFLLGNKKNPFPYVDKADVFVLTSRSEGQGLVIWEAKALGLSVIISKNLEQYNCGVPGSEDVVRAICQARRQPKMDDPLEAYNADCMKRFLALLQDV